MPQIDRVAADLIARIRTGEAPRSAGEGTSTAFESFLRSELEGTVSTMREAESVAQKGVVGLASTQEVVEAVTAAELALEKIVAVRDRVISAYQEIMRMPI